MIRKPYKYKTGERIFMNLDKDTTTVLDEIAKERFCANRPEVIRLLIRAYRETQKRVEEQKAYKTSTNSIGYEYMPPFTSGDRETSSNFKAFSDFI